MPTLADYLGLDRETARVQWDQVLRRGEASPGSRQVDFIPTETLVCLAASLIVNHRRYGGSSSHRAEEPVPTLARLFKRPNSSVLAKMANLDGSRRNGAKHELEAATRLVIDPERLSALYRVLLASARDVGIGPDRLPDFLGLEAEGSELVLLGQEELEESDIESVVQGSAESWSAARADLDQALTERLLVGAARIGQHRFARQVLSNHGHQCVFCGLDVASGQYRQRARRMLVASHIKPWRISTASERLDFRNGLAACPTHDVAFDTGLLTVNGGLRIHVSDVLAAAVQHQPAAAAAFGRPPLAERLLLPATAVAPNGRYLAWHRENIFQRA